MAHNERSRSAELQALLDSARDWGPGIYVRLSYALDNVENGPILTVSQLREEFDKHPYRFLRLDNFGRKSLRDLGRLLATAMQPSQEPAKPEEYSIRLIEYFEDGTVKRVEFFERARNGAQ